jgi:hypothetical protein
MKEQMSNAEYYARKLLESLPKGSTKINHETGLGLLWVFHKEDGTIRMSGEDFKEIRFGGKE